MEKGSASYRRNHDPRVKRLLLLPVQLLIILGGVFLVLFIAAALLLARAVHE